MTRNRRPLNEQAVMRWSTPRASLNENRTRHHPPSVAKGHGRTLAGDAAFHSLPAPMTTTAGAPISPSIPTAPPPSRVLNPTFVEALMNVPLGWTKMCECDGACLCSRLDRLRALGNGVVVSQGTEALRQLADRIGE